LNHDFVILDKNINHILVRTLNCILQNISDDNFNDGGNRIDRHVGGGTFNIYHNSFLFHDILNRCDLRLDHSFVDHWFDHVFETFRVSR
jgi:hypothetical protein